MFFLLFFLLNGVARIIDGISTHQLETVVWKVVVIAILTIVKTYMKAITAKVCRLWISLGFCWNWGRKWPFAQKTDRLWWEVQGAIFYHTLKAEMKTPIADSNLLCLCSIARFTWLSHQMIDVSFLLASIILHKFGQSMMKVQTYPWLCAVMGIL